MNILTGMIVEHVVEMSRGDDDCLMLEYRRKNALVTNELKKIFSSIHSASNGAITGDEFMESMKDEGVQALLADVGLEIHDAHWFFKMLLSLSDSDSVDIQHFVEACMKLKGKATSLDVQCIIFELRVVRKKISNLQRYISEGSTEPDHWCAWNLTSVDSQNSLRG